jgi:4-amino-4-deoxy-L-arabinose transferase-like glycosyltransferase
VRRPSKSWLPGTESRPVSWADLVVIPLIVILSVPPLVWFAHHWTVIGNDAGRYLFAGSQLISGQALEDLNSISGFNGGHGPGLPALVGSLILLFGHDTEALAWAVRLMALLNPLLAYLLVKRISSPIAGLIAAALVTLLGYNVKSPLAVNIDAPLLTVYLLTLLALLAAIKVRSSLLALLSGALLGISILTKETAFVNLPLAVLAVLLLDWNLRGALWHYLGVVLVCLPWWIWAYFATGDVYLVDPLPVGLQVPVLIATVTFLFFAAAAYASGLVARFLADERQRRWSGWCVVLGWTVSLSGLLLATAAYALGKLSFEEVRLYLAELLAPSIVVVPTLLLVVGYVAWKAVRGNGAWRLLALALLFQVPVCLLLTVQLWAPRQFLIPQTLLFCALGALVVDAGEVAWRGRDYSARLRGAIVAASLAILLLAASVERVQALLLQNPVSGVFGQHRVASQEKEMVNWMAQNVPEGEHILVVAEPAINASQANYLMFLDGGRHEWIQLQLDQAVCLPRPNVQIRCDLEKNDISRIPPEALWVQMVDRCEVISLSMPNLLKQLRQGDSEYVMIPGSHVFPSILELPLALQESDAFYVVHAELSQRVESGANQGVVLLESTGRAPKALPTQMNASTLVGLLRCGQAKGPGYKERIRSKFPNGISVRTGS